MTTERFVIYLLDLLHRALGGLGKFLQHA
ncbi:MAG: hypothetical protein QOJ15_10548, partial [Bradyrhizobium sp.]|nr:hypothetical protein [Bradyrhizobium sp.]